MWHTYLQLDSGFSLYDWWSAINIRYIHSTFIFTQQSITSKRLVERWIDWHVCIYIYIYIAKNILGKCLTWYGNKLLRLKLRNRAECCHLLIRRCRGDLLIKWQTGLASINAGRLKTGTIPLGRAVIPYTGKSSKQRKIIDYCDEDQFYSIRWVYNTAPICRGWIVTLVAELIQHRALFEI